MNRNIAVILSGRDAGLARTLGAASGAIDRFTNNIQNANTRAAKMATAMKFAFAALGVAVAIGLGAAVNQAVKFEQQMANVETVAHAGTTGIVQMGNAILNMATQLPQNTQTLTQGLYDIASSGFYGAEALEVLEVSAVAASAGITETGVAAKAVTAVLNAYGLGAEHAADVSDIMFKTVELGVITFEELATQLGDVIGASAAAGIEFEEIGSAIAAMTLSGLNAAEATTSLNRLIGKIIKPSENLAIAFKKMGFESGAAALEQEGLFGVMEMIRRVTGGQIQEIVKLFPEIRAARGAYALLAAEGTNYARVQAIITDDQARAGATQKAFNIQMEAAGNQMKLLGNRLQVFGIRVGTVLLPVLVDTMNFLSEMGTRIGDVLSDLGKMARPAFNVLGDMISELADLLNEIGDVISPIARGFASMVGGAVIASVVALGEAISFVAGFLADHPNLIKAVAIAYGGVLTGRLLAAAAGFVKLHGGLLLIRAGLAGLAAQAVLANLVTRIGALSSALYALVSIGNLNNLRNLSVAFSGLGTVLASPALAGTAIIAFLFAFQQGADKAKARAKELRAEIEADIDFSSLESINEAIIKINDRLNELSDVKDEYASVGGFLKFVAEAITPMENRMQDAAAESQELAGALKDLEQAGLNLWSASEQLQASLGLTAQEAERLLAELEFDPRQELTADALGSLVNEAERFTAAARQGTPATDNFISALETMADPTATATDRINALTDAIDSFVGTALGVSNAAIAWEQAIDDLTTAVNENGFSLDINGEKGRAVVSAINDATEAAAEHAKATLEDTGSIYDAAAVIAFHRGELINQLVAFGMARGEAEAYIDQLGLTPENINTLIDLENAEGAMVTLEQFEETLRLVDEAEATARVNIDSSKFDEDAIKIGDVLIQIEQAAPEAEVLLNGEKFVPTQQMVEAWAAHWDASSPQAQALLDIIDPENKFNTLEQAALNWDEAAPEATATVNSTQAINRFRAAEAKADAWDGSLSTASITARDHASAKIDAIQARLNALQSTKTVTIVTRDVRISSGPGGSGGVPVRYGGVFHAQHGLNWDARILKNPTVFAGERPTGGEAFIPRRGNVNRSLNILDTAAGWYGMEMRPRGGGGSSPSIIDNRTTVTVQVRAENITDQRGLVGAIKKVVKTELNEHDRKLARGLVSR